MSICARERPPAFADQGPESVQDALLDALKLILPYALTAPAWVIEAAQDAIKQAEGEAP